MEQNENHLLKANNDVYYGLAMFAGFFGFFGYVIDSPFIEKSLFGLAGLIMAGGMIDMIGYQKKRVIHHENTLTVYRGWFRRKQVIDLQKVEQITFIDTDNREYPLGSTDISEKKIKKVSIKISPEKTVELNEYDYNNERFNRFAVAMQDKVKEANLSEKEKLSFSLENCDKLIAQDKLLIKELTNSMQQTYASIYQQHVLVAEPEEKERIKEQLKAPHILYYYTNDLKSHYYFEQNDYLPNIEEDDKYTAENLILTATQNIEIANQRIQAYRQLQEKMTRIIQQYQHREQLQQVAAKLSSLQEKNLEYDHQIGALEYDAEVFGELQKLMTTIQQADTADQAEILKQYITEFQKTKK